jgi:MFS family permease
VISRTGRYKWITVGALLLLAAGLALMGGLSADTPPPVLWFWQFVAGIGIGPTLAVFTIIVQNAVPWQQLGVATSNLTFFRQVGGSVGLAIAGTIFGSTLATEAPRQVVAAVTAAGMPPAQVQLLGSQLATGFNLDDLAGVGNLGARILAGIPGTARPLVEPYLPQIVRGIYEALSLGIANTMWLGVIGALIAAALTLALREAPLRSTHRAESPAARPVEVAPAE